MNSYHGAKYSDVLMEPLSIPLQGRRLILDPFGGSGKAHSLSIDLGATLVASDIEFLFARMGCDLVSDALHLPYRDATFDAMVTSVTYGNGMNDNSNFTDNAGRNTYVSWLRRMKPDACLHPNNTGGYSWARGGHAKKEAYQVLHRKAYNEVWRCLKKGGIFILNVSDHIAKKEQQFVSEWHEQALVSIGMLRLSKKNYVTRRNKFGRNRNARVPYEHIYVFEKP